jgi:type I restriction enzyme S subunit
VPATQRQVANCSLQKGDILFNLTNSAEQVGKSALWVGVSDETVCFSNHFLRLRVNAEKIIPEYLIRFFAYLWRLRVFERMVNSWVNQSTVRKEELFGIRVPLPPLSEQKRIAAILDKADQLRQKRQQAIGLADEFLRSVFLDMFGDPVTNPKGWEVKPLKAVAQSQLGKMLSKKAKLGVNPKKYLRNANVRWRNIELDDLLEMDFTDQECIKFSLNKGDILVCEGGEVGRCAIWKEEMEDCYFQKALHRVRVDSTIILPEYMQEYFFWMARKGGLTDSVSQVTFSHLTGERLKELPVPVPSFDIQKKFINIHAQLDQRVQKLKLSGNTLQRLFNALSQKAFAGEL